MNCRVYVVSLILTYACSTVCLGQPKPKPEDHPPEQRIKLLVQDYKTLELEQSELAYDDHLKTFRAMGQKMVTDSQVLIDLWTNTVGGHADLRGKTTEAQTAFRDAVATASQTTWNSNVRKVGDKGVEVMEFLTQLRNEALKQDLSAEKKAQLNIALRQVEMSIAAYSDFWTKRFKPLAEKHQIAEQIRTKVLNALNEKEPKYSAQKDELSKFEKELKDLAKRRDDLLIQYAGLHDPTGGDRVKARSILDGLDKIDAEMNEKDAQLKKLKRSVEAAQDILKSVQVKP